MISKLKCSVKEITHIVHVADLHIRLTKRHEEYAEVFEKFYNEVKLTPKSTVICVLGDVFHNKSDLSPEAIQTAKNFLFTCANLRPTIVIAGNHDAILNNKNRLDSLTPLIDAIAHSDLFYFKKSGLYVMGGVLFSVYSVFDPENFVKFEDIPSVYKNEYSRFIAMIHAPIDTSLTDMGFKIENRFIRADTFDGYDICLAGDIHKHQDIRIELEVGDDILQDYLETGDWTAI